MQTIRVQLKEPTPITSVGSLTTEIYQAIKKYGMEVNPLDAVSLLAGTRWAGPLEKFGNGIKLVEVYEVKIEPRGDQFYDSLHTFYGSTSSLRVEDAFPEWKKHFEGRDVGETRAYFVEQVGDTKTLFDFWRKIGRNIEPEGGIERKRIKYGATPIAEPFDFIIYPQPKEFHCSTYSRDFLEYSMNQKNNIRQHLENILGRKIEIKESLVEYLLKKIKEDSKVTVP